VSPIRGLAYRKFAFPPLARWAASFHR